MGTFIRRLAAIGKISVMTGTKRDQFLIDKSWLPLGRGFGLVFLECGTKEPVVLEALDKLIAVDNNVRNLTEHVGVGLDLVVQVARDVGQILQRAANLLEDRHQVGVRVDHGAIDVGERAVGIEQRQAELLVQVGRN